MKENAQTSSPPKQQHITALNNKPGPARSVPQIRRKLMDGREIILWGKPEMEAVFIRKGIKVRLADPGAPLPNGRYHLEDGSELVVAKGKVKRFDRKYVSLREIVIAAILGLALVFLLYYYYVVTGSS